MGSASVCRAARAARPTPAARRTGRRVANLRDASNGGHVVHGVLSAFPPLRKARAEARRSRRLPSGRKPLTSGMRVTVGRKGFVQGPPEVSSRATPDGRALAAVPVSCQKYPRRSLERRRPRRDHAGPPRVDSLRGAAARPSGQRQTQPPSELGRGASSAASASPRRPTRVSARAEACSAVSR